MGFSQLAEIRQETVLEKLSGNKMDVSLCPHPNGHWIIIFLFFFLLLRLFVRIRFLCSLGLNFEFEKIFLDDFTEQFFIRRWNAFVERADITDVAQAFF